MNLKPFKCDYCDKQFKRKFHLTRHMVAHSENPKPFTCTIENCTQRFSNKHHLTRHVKIIHDQDRYRCKLCDTRFKKKSQLQKHIKESHYTLYNQDDFTPMYSEDAFFYEDSIEKKVKKGNHFWIIQSLREFLRWRAVSIGNGGQYHKRHRVLPWFQLWCLGEGDQRNWLRFSSRRDEISTKERLLQMSLWQLFQDFLNGTISELVTLLIWTRWILSDPTSERLIWRWSPSNVFNLAAKLNFLTRTLWPAIASKNTLTRNWVQNLLGCLEWHSRITLMLFNKTICKISVTIVKMTTSQVF